VNKLYISQDHVLISVVIHQETSLLTEINQNGWRRYKYLSALNDLHQCIII